MVNITIKQMRAFIAVAAEGSFTKAADSLHVTQSTLTSSIKVLEDEVGLQLFDRSTRSVIPTRQGELFLPTAQRILRDLEDALDDLRMVAERERGSVSVCAAGSFITYVLTPALMDLARQHPGIHTRFTEGTTQSVAQQVLSGEADFGVTTLFEPIPELDATLLLTDAYGAVYGAEHPLNDEHASLTWNKLSKHTMVRLSKANGIRILLDSEPKIAGLFKNTVYEVSGVAALQALLSRGFGFSALPALAARSLVVEGLRFSILARPGIRRKLYVVKKKGRSLSPAAVALFRAMIEALQDMTPDEAIDVTFTQSEIRAFCGI
ncbi:LysR family transcriptional regulator [Advenella kashmirensis WT001]|uniref:LysR family transcriptional regulator n=1 Tax=Advenella kashmirensis (strain DSM 17095 / LMG 22695 / WT001) TaxID=1036672 RepID=I3UCX4_ADVKW|nr:LysR family transcriptional regulator [Advenella kashmirensis]AFK62862.1 LysR family transcriptional regulator [Advenella kashmirensis WT001]